MFKLKHDLHVDLERITRWSSLDHHANGCSEVIENDSPPPLSSFILFSSVPKEYYVM